MTLKEKHEQSVKEYWNLYERLRKEKRLHECKADLEAASLKLQRNWLSWVNSEVD